MSFNSQKRLDPSQVQDRRGRSTGRNVVVGGGGIGILVLLVAMFLGVDPSALLGAASSGPEYADGYYQDAGGLPPNARLAQTPTNARTANWWAL